MLEIEDAQTLGAWKMLCMATFYEAVCLINGSSRWGDCAYSLDQQRAKRWIEEGDIGVITFDECCEMTGVKPEIARAKIIGCVSKLRRKPAYKRDRFVHEAISRAT
jgi:hypothetical protein